MGNDLEVFEHYYGSGVSRQVDATRTPRSRVPCPTSEGLLVAGLLDLSVEADMDRNEGLAGEKPLSAVDSERPGACFSNRLKQGVVRTRYSLGSLHEWPKVHNSVTAGNGFAVAEGDRISVRR